MAWQPEQDALRQLSGCLKDSLSGHDKNAQKQAEIVSKILSVQLMQYLLHVKVLMSP